MKIITTISLILLMLTSSIGLSVNTHFCGDKALMTSVSLGLEHTDCGMDNMDEPCETKSISDLQIVSEKCCENQIQIIQLDESIDLLSTSTKVNFIVFVSFIHSFGPTLFYPDQVITQNIEYPFPTPEKDAQILFQTFLI